MENDSPLVSIKVASYNHARFIGETIRSVLGQSYQNFELIIIDDCSHDDSVKVIRNFNDSRITLLVNESNIGTAASSKKAGKLCRGKYFCSLDSDDYFHPDKLAKQVMYMETHPEIDLVATFVREVDGQGNFIMDFLAADWFNWGLDLNQPESWLWENHVCHSSVLMKKDVHDRLWDYDSGLRYTNDWSNWIRFLAGGVRFEILPEKLTFYRRHSENVSQKNPVRSYWEYAYISATILHPYLEKINRRDLVQDNIERFLSDACYPGTVVEKNRFLRLLLDVDKPGRNFEPVWADRFVEDAGDNSGTRYELLLIEDLRQKLIDSRLRIDSMWQELRHAEKRAFRMARLKDVLFSEEFSLKKLTKAGYVGLSCIVPDFVQWLFRPVSRFLWRLYRHLQSPRGMAAYQVQVQPANRQRKRVLHVIANFMMGGSSQLVVDLVEALGHIYQQKVLTAFIPSPAAYEGIAVYECCSEYEMRPFLAKFQPDLIHVHYWGDSDWAWYDKVFRLIEEFDCEVVENVNTPVVPYRTPVVRRYVYVSDYVMQNFGHLGEASEVIYPGSDVELYSREDLDTVPNNCIGMVYRLEADKLNAQSIDVFIRVAKCRPGTRILIIGDGSFLNLYKQAVLAQGVENAFCFTGAVSYARLPELYAQMSVFVAPVWKESFGQVSVFAMGMGIPVAGYRVGGLEDIVNNPELLATPGNSGELADIVVDLLDNREKRLAIGADNRRRANSLFSVESMTRRYEMLYRNVIDANT